MGSLLQGCTWFLELKKPRPRGKRSSLSHCHREPCVLTHFTGLIYSRNSEPLKWKEGCISPTAASMITCQGHTVPLSPRLLRRDHYLSASTYTEGKKISKPLALKSWQTRTALWITSEWQPYHDQMVNILTRISLTLGPVKPRTYLWLSVAGTDKCSNERNFQVCFLTPVMRAVVVREANQAPRSTVQER